MSQYRHLEELVQGRNARHRATPPPPMNQGQELRSRVPSTLDTLQTSYSPAEPHNAQKRAKRRVKAKKQSVAMSDRLVSFDPRRADRMRDCGGLVEVYSCASCEHEKGIRANHCGDRFCETCARKRADELHRQWVSVLESYQAGGLQASPRYGYLLTLTWLNLKILRDRTVMSRQVRKMIHHQVWEQFGGICGGIQSWEVTWGKRHTFHPHVHILVYFDREIPQHFLSDIPKHPELAPIWKRITRDSDQVDIRRFDGNYREIFKYVTKTDHLLSMPLDMLEQLAAWLKGMRTIVRFGELLGMKANEEESAQESRINAPCELCACTVVKIEKQKYCHTTGEYLVIETDYSEVLPNPLRE